MRDAELPGISRASPTGRDLNRTGPPSSSGAIEGQVNRKRCSNATLSPAWLPGRGHLFRSTVPSAVNRIARDHQVDLGGAHIGMRLTLGGRDAHQPQAPCPRRRAAAGGAVHVVPRRIHSPWGDQPDRRPNRWQPRFNGAMLKSLDASTLTIAGLQTPSLILQPTTTPVEVDLRHAKVGVFSTTRRAGQRHQRNRTTYR